VTEQHRHQLHEAFEVNSQTTPDPAAVYARVEELAGKYRRRRRGAYVAGGAVLSAGLIAGVLNLPSVLPSDPGTGNAGLPAAAPAVTPSSGLPDYVIGNEVGLPTGTNRRFQFCDNAQSDG